MNKQVFLSFSLPYGLKCKEVGLNEIFNFSTRIYNLMSILNWNNSYQPILRPLSDLTREIEHNGEKFIPIDRLNFLYDYTKIGYLYRYTTEYLNEVDWQSEPFEVVKKLIEWKFDIADFISTGEAIDLNTFDVNPYK